MVAQRTEKLHNTVIELQKAQSELQKKEEKYRIVANYTYDWEYWTNTDGEFLYVSPSCERITGYSAEDFYKNKNLLISIIHPDDIEHIKYHKHKLNDKNEREPIEFRIITKNDSIEWIGHVCVEVIDGNGRARGIRANNRIITENKKADEIIKEKNEALQLLNQNKDRFVTILSHDLRSPFNALLGFSGLLLRNLDTYSKEKIKEQLDIINQVTYKTYNLLNDLLLWSKSSAGKLPMTKEKIDLSEIAKDMHTEMQANAETKNIILKNNINSIIVIADEYMLKIILRNLYQMP